ncbi:sin3b-related [Anaeramoeba flamelloides]|uniref:Sin3b-related n=1 Tax=Anaeramoeba flamelloides TaxID=1746091 RepID=A0ABQ8XLU1_9EUKA|nr:sin3b-related [Anaeramoeba flamelloides]
MMSMDQISKNTQFTPQVKFPNINKTGTKNKRTSQIIRSANLPYLTMNKLNEQSQRHTIWFQSLQNTGSKNQNKKTQVVSTNQETKKINRSLEKESVLNSTTQKSPLNIDKFSNFLDLVRNRFKDKPEIYQKYLSITISKQYFENYQENSQLILNLFSGHPKLINRHLELVNGEYEYNSGNLKEPNSTIRKAIEFISFIRRSFPQNISDKYLQLMTIFQKLEQNNNKITIDLIKDEVFKIFEGNKGFANSFNNFLSTFILKPEQNGNKAHEKDLDIFLKNNDLPNLKKEIEKNADEQKKQILNSQSLIFSKHSKDFFLDFPEQKGKKEYPLFFTELFPINQNYRSQRNLSNLEIKNICNKMYEKRIIKNYECIDNKFENRNLKKKDIQKIEIEKEKIIKNVDGKLSGDTIIQNIIEKLLVNTSSNKSPIVNRKRGFDNLSQNNNININTNFIKGVFKTLKRDLYKNDYFSLLKLINNYLNNRLNFNQFINLSENILNKKQNSELFERFYSIFSEKGVLKTFTAPGNISKGSLSALSPNLIPNKIRKISKNSNINHVYNTKWNYSNTNMYDNSKFIFSKNNPYNQLYFYSENERRELDILIKNNHRSIRLVKNLFFDLNHAGRYKSIENIINYTTKDDLFLNSVSQIYGRKTIEIMKSLNKNPLTTLHIIFERLKQRNIQLIFTKNILSKIWNYITFDYENFQNVKVNKK